jgi:hypothetical protein
MAFASNATYPSGASYPVASFPSGFSILPNQYQGLQCWHNSESLTKDGADRISSVDDLSGNARPFTQIAALNQPLWVANQLNTKPCIRFNGTTEFLTTAVFSVNQPFTMYIVLKQISWTNGDRIISRPDGTQTIIYQNSTTPTIQQFAGGSGPTTTAGTIGNWIILAAVFNNASSSLLVNAGNESTGTSGTNSVSGLCMGANAGGINNFANIDIAEFVLYDQAQSLSVRRNLINNYFNMKWRVF